MRLEAVGGGEVAPRGTRTGLQASGDRLYVSKGPRGARAVRKVLRRTAVLLQGTVQRAVLVLISVVEGADSMPLQMRRVLVFLAAVLL